MNKLSNMIHNGMRHRLAEDGFQVKHGGLLGALERGALRQNAAGGPTAPPAPASHSHGVMGGIHARLELAAERGAAGGPTAPQAHSGGDIMDKIWQQAVQRLMQRNAGGKLEVPKNGDADQNRV